MVASLIEVIVGGCGLVVPLLRRIGPLTVAPTIGLIGLSLFKLPSDYAAMNPAIALGYVQTYIYKQIKHVYNNSSTPIIKVTIKVIIKVLIGLSLFKLPSNYAAMNSAIALGYVKINMYLYTRA